MKLTNIARLAGGVTLVLALTGVTASPASAQAVLDAGNVSMGVFNHGGLGYSGVGLSLDGVGDAITPGCLCEGWGAAANGVGTFYTYGGATAGISTVSWTPGLGPADGMSTVLFTNGLEVTQTYSAAGPNMFKLDITLENTTGVDMTDVRYARTLDWDVPPGHFSDDFSTIYTGSPGGAPAGDVLHTSLWPFDVPNPMVERNNAAWFPDQNKIDEPGDLGGYFILGFGTLGAGETHTFANYIGAFGTTSALLAAFGSVGIEAYSYTFDDDGGATFGWGFGGIGLPPAIPPTGVPEPATASLLLLGTGVATVVRRYRRS